MARSASNNVVWYVGGGLALTTLVIVLLRGSGKPKPKVSPGQAPPPLAPLPTGPTIDWKAGANIGVWNIGNGNGQWCGVPLIPTVTANYGEDVKTVGGAYLVWGWTPPGDLRAALKYGKRLIADCELRASTKAKPSAGWKGDELAQAKALAPLCHGVTSHGFVPPSIKAVLMEFAQAGGVAYPQVYDTDRSTLNNPGGPRAFLNTCVESYRKIGFERVVPVLGASAGEDIMAEWIDECRLKGYTYTIWSEQRLKGMKFTCDIIQAP